jgi:hypothetical protein
MDCIPLRLIRQTVLLKLHKLINQMEVEWAENNHLHNWVGRKSASYSRGPGFKISAWSSVIRASNQAREIPAYILSVLN